MHLKNCVLLFAISHLAIAGSCYASSLDLSTCTFANGVKVPDDECAVYRRLEEQKKALADQREKQRLEAVEAEARFQQERQKAAHEMSSFLSFLLESGFRFNSFQALLLSLIC